jgi:hypothetical protein
MSIGYFLSNMAGMWLMAYSAKHLHKPFTKHLWPSVLISVVFTMLTITLSWQFPTWTQAVLPNWVQ